MTTIRDLDRESEPNTIIYVTMVVLGLNERHGRRFAFYHVQWRYGTPWKLWGSNGLSPRCKVYEIQGAYE